MISCRAVKGTRAVTEETEAIERLVEAFERSQWSEIDVRFGATRVHLAARQDGVEPEPSDRVETAAAADRPADDENDSVRPSVPEGALVVTSPSPGILWRSPMPGAPPFAEVGQTVKESDTVCIIEVMKLMNHVKAGVAGTVVAALVANGAQVAKDEPLFAIRPEREAPTAVD
jgi:acetyl-CoA carboxylase biotin carboxyl carrier protein